METDTLVFEPLSLHSNGHYDDYVAKFKGWEIWLSDMEYISYTEEGWQIAIFPPNEFHVDDLWARTYTTCDGAMRGAWRALIRLGLTS